MENYNQVMPSKDNYYLIIENRNGDGTLKNTSLRFVAWDEAENNSSPPVLTIKHQEKLLNASRQEDILFARKFDERIDAEIIDFVDRLRFSPKY